MRVDARKHFWRLDRGDYGWLTPDLAPIYRDFLPNDIEPFLARHAIDGTVLVQAAPTEAETEFMLRLSDENSFILGVVGWVIFESPASAERLRSFARHPAFVGVRPMIQDIPDTNWMLGDALAPAFESVIANHITFDALTLPRHLPNLRKLLARYPTMRVVIDHGSKPQIAEQTFDIWATDIAALAGDSSAYCKLSGLITEASDTWTTHDIKPYVDHLLESFGPSRLIWGSDRPVCTLAGSYDQWIEITETLLCDLTEPEKASVMGGNALKAYSIERPK